MGGLKSLPEESSIKQEGSLTFFTSKYINKTIFVWHKRVNEAINIWMLLAQELRKSIIHTPVKPLTTLFRKLCITQKSKSFKISPP